jgi:ABC-type Na+ transport system ATPase subunit NatA
VLQIINLTKRYGRHTAVDDLTLEALPGEVLVLLTLAVTLLPLVHGARRLERSEH